MKNPFQGFLSWSGVQAKRFGITGFFNNLLSPLTKLREGRVDPSGQVGVTMRDREGVFKKTGGQPIGAAHHHLPVVSVHHDEFAKQISEFQKRLKNLNLKFNEESKISELIGLLPFLKHKSNYTVAMTEVRFQKVFGELSTVGEGDAKKLLDEINSVKNYIETNRVNDIRPSTNPQSTSSPVQSK